MQKRLFFITLFSLATIVTLAHTTFSLNHKKPDSYNQTFEAIPNYLGEPYLVSDLIANFEEGTSEVILTISYDGKTWEEVDREAIHHLHRGSYENTLLHFEIDHLEAILNTMQQDEVYFRTSYIQHESEQILTESVFNKKTLQNWYKQSKK